MSRIPSHGVPSYQSNIDHSHNGTSFGNYINQGYHASGRGIINISPQTTNYLSSPSNPLEALERRCSSTAAFDSAARFDPPRCAESTRRRIIQIIEEWVNTNGANAVPGSLFWLHGGAGVGKSALAQSLSEGFQVKKGLAASFFFSRSDATRNNGDQLIPTLVSQLVDTFEEILPFVEASIRHDRALFTKRYQSQIRDLLIEPLLSLKSRGARANHPRLIVIDGLDECDNPDVQCELLRVIALAIRRIPYPLRFLITSRPEAHIMDVFNRDPNLQAIAVKYNLSDDPDADMDIRKFLETEFVDIHRAHRLGVHLPHTWPGQKIITSLIERSSGHFVYASTVIKYIRSAKHRPDDRLEVILHLRPPQAGDQPYAHLDALYGLVFEGVESPSQLEKICLVLGILYFQSQRVGLFETLPGYLTIEELLEMKTGDLVLLLDPILSLIAIDGYQVHVLHKSLFDYLLDFTRGGHLPFDLARVHAVAPIYILKHRIMMDMCNLDDLRYFAFHCQYAYLNDTLKDYLHSLEVPYPEFVMPTPNTFSCLRDLVSYFFRTLSREDFDPTGQLFAQYAGKWMACCHSDVPRCTVAKLENDLKRKLDTLLTRWIPQDFNPMDLGMGPVRDTFIKQEHSVISALFEITAERALAVTSSLVFGDYFVHRYDLGISDGKPKILILKTYWRHGNICYQDWRHSSGNPDFDFVLETRNYLRRAENYLLSDLYQMYGV